MDKTREGCHRHALWRADVALKDFRYPTKIPDRTLRRILAKLWTEKMGVLQYLHNLVESMPFRLQDMLERDVG